MQFPVIYAYACTQVVYMREYMSIYVWLCVPMTYKVLDAQELGQG